jgi:radical SAM superfamily enzyme YgiQ (UPF0313 family)
MARLGKKIIFINPPLTLEERYGKLKAGGNTLPNLGLCYLASIAKSKNWEVNIIDASALKLNLEEIVNHIRREKPDAVGITATTPAIERASSIAKGVKQVLPSVKILIGGPHVSALPGDTLREFECFDIGIIGEGEDTLSEILEYLEEKRSLSEIKGIVYRDKEEIVSTPLRDFISDLDRLPFPCWELLPPLTRFYRPSLQCVKRLPATILIISRGCPYNCIFCDHSVFGYKIRAHSSDYVLSMIEYLLKNYGIKEFAIHDECLLADRKRAIELCENLLKRNLKISWTVQVRADQVEAGLLELFKKAGCWQIQIGIESGSLKILKLLNKGVARNQIWQACHLIKKTGLMLKGFFMLGNIGETPDTIEESIRFALDLPLDDFQLTYFTPYPGSPVYKNITLWGRMLTEEFSKMNEYNLSFLPYGVDRVTLERAFKTAYAKFYFRPKIIFRHVKNLREVNLWKAYLKVIWEFVKFSL